ncbi:MAG: hypothetical protein E7Z80_06820 [Methanobrevibacter thaueri]|nr:hypothetical protein [Methanobrevibacter thaueri]
MVRRNKRLGIDLETRPYYSKLKDISFARLTNSQLFSLAFTVGYLNGFKKPLTKRFDIIRHETIPLDLFSIIMLVAIKEYGEEYIKELDNPLELFDMAEEYANAGIEILMKKIRYDSDLENFLISNIMRLYGDNDFNSKYERLFSE